MASSTGDDITDGVDCVAEPCPRPNSAVKVERHFPTWPPSPMSASAWNHPPRRPSLDCNLWPPHCHSHSTVSQIVCLLGSIPHFGLVLQKPSAALRSLVSSL